MMQTAKAHRLLQTLTRGANKHKAGAYYHVHIAWLDCKADEQAKRLALIQRAAREDAEARAQLDGITEAWQRKYGRRTRYGSVLRAHLDGIGNGVHDVWGNRRTAWQRFAVYVALRACTSHAKYQAQRASYAQIGALSLGYPTIAAATAAGCDTGANKGLYRRVQRSVHAISRAGLVLQFRQQGYRTAWYSYRLSTPDVAKSIAAEQAINKRNISVVRQLISDIGSAQRIEPSQAASIYADVKNIGWHDAELITLPREHVAKLVTATECIGGRRYVRLTRTTQHDYQHAIAQLHGAIGRHLQREAAS